LKKHLLALCALLTAGSASACFTVYDSTNRVLYRGLDAPVNMERQLHETVPAKFGEGAKLVFDTSNVCPVVQLWETPRPRGGDVPKGSVQWARDVSDTPDIADLWKP
jgi:hypothetical protein